MRKPTPTARPSPRCLARIPLFAAILLLAASLARGQSADPDFTFFVFSDIHLGVEKPKADPSVTAKQSITRMQSNLDRMRALVGDPFPKQGPLANLDLGNIAAPRGLFILGDLTDGHKEAAKRQEQWKMFEDLFPTTGVRFGDKSIPVFAFLGNHDGEATGPQGQGLIRQHREMQAKNNFAALSENGLHFALNWEGIHFICVNLCPADTVDEENIFKYGKPGKGSWNDPQGALNFLKDYLKNKVGSSNQPVFILQHYGFDGFSMNDWNWWTPKQRRAMYEAIKDYNIAAIIHGHNHHAEHYTWPDPKKHAKDIQAMFGDTPPASVRQFDILSCGGTCWVMRIKGQQFFAAHVKGPDWDEDPAFFVTKNLAPAANPTPDPAPQSKPFNSRDPQGSAPARKTSSQSSQTTSPSMTSSSISPVPLAARPLPLSAVRLTGGPLKHAQDLDAQYLLKLEPDRMLAYFRIRAGLAPKAKPYAGWDGDNKNLTGHVAGHYLSAISYMYAATGDERFKQRADYIIKELKEVQDKHGDGYLGALAQGREKFAEVARGDIRSGGFDLNGLWSPWYVLHKIYAGLRDAYRLTGNRTALDLEIGFAKWAEGILAKLDDAQIQKMLNTEFGAMNEVFADLYADTGDARWLALADKFHHKAVVDPLAAGKNILDGKHGNTQVPKLLGSLVRYFHTGRTFDRDAARFFWDQVVDHHTFATGGHGQDEYFNLPDHLNDHIDGRTAETCNVYNMLKFARLLFALKPDPRYAEYHERALFNHILASIDPKDGWTCYMVPVGRGVKHEYERNMLDGGFACCVGTGMESHALHGHGIYYESPAADKLWVNLFVPSIAQWKAAGATITMETDFPEGDDATIKITLEKPREFTLAIRRPSWAGDGFSVKLNKQPIEALAQPGSYIEVKRTWSSDDTITLRLPKTLRAEPLPDNPSRMAFLWGPLVLAGDLGPENQKLKPSQTTGLTVPVFVTAEPMQKWLALAGLTRAAGKTIVDPDQGALFRTQSVGRDHDVDFVPFYRLHRRTYAIYWDVFTPQAWEKKAAEYAAEQQRQRKLQEATIAYAQPGEMQPERDFNFQGEDSRPVRVMDRPGRRGTKWFSFDLPVDPGHPLALVITCSTEERHPRNFEILVDGQRLALQKIERSTPSRFFDIEYPLAASQVQNKQKITVKFQAAPHDEIATIFGLRIIRKDGDR